MKRPLGWRVPLWFLVLCSAAFLGARTVAAEAAVTYPPVRFALRGRCRCSLPSLGPRSSARCSVS